MAPDAALTARHARVEAAVVEACRAAGRARDEVTLIVVTKFHPASLIRDLAALGVRDVGENRHQDAAPKAEQLTDPPLTWHCVGQRHASGVDEYVSGTLGYQGGVLASFSCGMSVQSDNAALICGELGYIRVPVPWKPPVDGGSYEVRTMTPPRQDGVSRTKSDERVVAVPPCGPLYGMEADDFAATVLEGRPPAMPEADSLSNMRVLDALRRMI